MVKPTDSKTPNRPLLKASEGREIVLKATILRSGHASSTVLIGASEVQIANATLREVSGEPDL